MLWLLAIVISFSLAEDEIDKEICRIFQSEPVSGTLFNDPSHLALESDTFWRTLVDGLSDKDLRQLQDVSTDFGRRLKANDFPLSAEGYQQMKVYEKNPIQPCDLTNSPILVHFRKVMDFHSPSSLDHPMRKLLAQSRQAILSLGAIMGSLKSLAMFLGFVNSMGSFLKRAIARVNKGNGNHYIPQWILNVVNSGFIVGMADYFDHLTGGAAKFQVNVLTAYGIFEFVKAIGGFKAIKEVYLNIEKLPVIQMMKQSFAQTFVYKHVWAPVANFTRVAYKRTATYLKNIGSTKDPEFEKLHRFQKVALLNGIPDDALELLTDDQKLELMKSRFAARKDRGVQKSIPIASKAAVRRPPKPPIDFEQLDPEAQRLYDDLHPSIPKSKAKVEKKKKKGPSKTNIAASESEDSD